MEQARTNTLWREQIKKFEAGKFYKSIPLELVCEGLDSFGAPAEKPKRAARPKASAKMEKAEEPQAEEGGAAEPVPMQIPGPTPEGE